MRNVFKSELRLEKKSLSGKLGILSLILGIEEMNNVCWSKKEKWNIC